MNYLKIPFCLSLFLSTILLAQTKQITLEDIWSDGTFRTERMDVLHSMANGQQYSVLNFDRVAKITSIDIYDYKTLKKVKTLVSSENLSDITYFSNYAFSSDEKKILLATNEVSVYRRSSLGNYYVFDTENESVHLISEEKIQEPTFSPDGTKVAFAKDNNLYVKDLHSHKTTQITFDGKVNEIINGITDWVYEEEFAFVRAFDWNTASNKIAFIRFDETKVPEFSMDIYGTQLYQTQQVFKYPKAGETNSIVSLHVYNFDTNNNLCNLDEFRL